MTAPDRIPNERAEPDAGEDAARPQQLHGPIPLGDFHHAVAEAQAHEVWAFLAGLAPELAHAYVQDHFDGAAAIHVAAWRGRPDVMQALLEAGADLNARDAEGRTPLQAAMHMLDRALEHEDCRRGDRQLRARREARRAMVGFLIGVGADPRIGTQLNETPPWHACDLQDATLLRELLVGLDQASRSAYLSMSEEGPPGYTLLHKAVACRAPECAQVLLRFGADPHFAPPGGVTALQLARELRAIEMIEVLTPPSAVAPIRATPALSPMPVPPAAANGPGGRSAPYAFPPPGA